jgi:hypothetical protein
LYYLEYTLQNPGERRRHIVSAIGMAFNGWYNRLYTVTGQVSRRAPATKLRPSPNNAAASSAGLINISSKCCRLSRCMQYIDDDDDSEKYRPQIEKVRRTGVSILAFYPLFFFSYKDER